jgi:hypothetical protein
VRATGGVPARQPRFSVKILTNRSQRGSASDRQGARVRPRHPRAFFEALAADNLDIGRPDNMEIIFSRQVRCVTMGVFRTAAGRDNDGVVINAFYRHSPIKTYLTDGRALRAGTVINDACDTGVMRRLEHFGELTAKARDINGRLMQAMHAGQDCVLASPAIERGRIAHPHRGWQEGADLRFCEPRVMALAGALSLMLADACGLTSKSLRALTARLPGASYTASQMTYDPAQRADPPDREHPAA